MDACLVSRNSQCFRDVGGRERVLSNFFDHPDRAKISHEAPWERYYSQCLWIYCFGAHQEAQALLPSLVATAQW